MFLSLRPKLTGTTASKEAVMLHFAFYLPILHYKKRKELTTASVLDYLEL